MKNILKLKIYIPLKNFSYYKNFLGLSRKFSICWLISRIFCLQKNQNISISIKYFRIQNIYIIIYIFYCPWDIGSDTASKCYNTYHIWEQFDLCKAFDLELELVGARGREFGIGRHQNNGGRSIIAVSVWCKKYIFLGLEILFKSICSYLKSLTTY